MAFFSAIWPRSLSEGPRFCIREKVNEVESILINEFNFACKYIEEKFVNYNLLDFKKVQKIAVQFNNERQSLNNFYDTRNYV